MTVRELIETLEELPQDYPAVTNDIEVSEVVIRNEVYFTEDHFYKERTIVKIY
jgi:hypothetical protein